jgi:AcrR family transcriptional regulator
MVAANSRKETKTNPPRLTRAEAKAKRLEDLLAAAERLFLRQGYYATSLDEIAAEAGLTKGAVYSNFANKEQLFLTLMERGQVRFGALAMFQDPTLTPNEAFRRLGEAMIAAGPLDPQEAALVLEIRAVVLRSPAAQRAYAARMQPPFLALAEDIERQRPTNQLTVSGLESVLIQQALSDGLLMMRALYPELVEPSLYPKAMALLAGLFPPEKQNEPGAANIAPLDSTRALERSEDAGPAGEEG